MKRLLFPLLLLPLLLSACGAAKNATTTGDGTDPGAGTLPPLSQVAVGIFKLEGTGQAVTAEQASKLLPLWQVYSSLSQSDTAAKAEVDALVQQMQDGMSSDQMKAIQDMKLTQQDVFALMQEKGMVMGGPQASGTQTSENNGRDFVGPVPGGQFDGKPPAGGSGPVIVGPGGGAMPGGNVQVSGTPQAGGQNGMPRGVDRIPSPLVEAVIQLLKERAGS